MNNSHEETGGNSQLLETTLSCGKMLDLVRHREQVMARSALYTVPETNGGAKLWFAFQKVVSQHRVKSHSVYQA